MVVGGGPSSSVSSTTSSSYSPVPFYYDAASYYCCIFNFDRHKFNRIVIQRTKNIKVSTSWIKQSTLITSF